MVSGYYNIQCSIAIDSTSISPAEIEIVSTNNNLESNNFLIRLENGYGSYSSSGIFVKYFNNGDNIRIINKYNNCLLYQNDNNYGALKIILL